jgi:hypothetical protein
MILAANFVAFTLDHTTLVEQPPVLILALDLALMIAFVVSSVLRCWSLNWSGWRVLAFPVPIAGLVLLLLLAFRPTVNIGEKQA